MPIGDSAIPRVVRSVAPCGLLKLVNTRIDAKSTVTSMRVKSPKEMQCLSRSFRRTVK